MLRNVDCATLRQMFQMWARKVPILSATYFLRFKHLSRTKVNSTCIFDLRCLLICPCLFSSLLGLAYLKSRRSVPLRSTSSSSKEHTQTQGISSLLPILDSERHPSCRSFNIAHFNIAFWSLIVPFFLWVIRSLLASCLNNHSPLPSGVFFLSLSDLHRPICFLVATLD